MDQELENRIFKIERELKQSSELIAELYRESGNLTTRNAKLIKDMELEIDRKLKNISESIGNIPKADKKREAESKKIAEQLIIIESLKAEMEKVKRQTTLMYRALDALTKYQSDHPLDERIKNVAKEAENQVFLLRSEMDGMAKSIEKSMHDMKSFGKEAHSAIEELDNYKKDTTKSLGKDFDGIDKRIQSINSALKNEYDKINSQTSSFASMLNNHNSSLETIRKRLGRIEESALNAKPADLSEIKGEIAALRTKLGSLESSISSSLKKSVSEFAEQIKSDEKQLFKWERDIQISKKEIEQTKDGIEKLRFEMYDRERKLKADTKSSAKPALPAEFKKLTEELQRKERETENSSKRLIGEMKNFAKEKEFRDLNDMVRIKLERMEKNLREISDSASKQNGVSKEELESLRNELALRVEIKMKEVEQTLSRVESSLEAFATNGDMAQKNIDLLKSDIIELFQNKHNESNKLIASHIERLQNRLNELEKKNNS